MNKMSNNDKWLEEVRGEFQETELFKNSGNDSFSESIDPFDAYVEGRKADRDKIAEMEDEIENYNGLLHEKLSKNIELAREITHLKVLLKQAEPYVLSFTNGAVVPSEIIKWLEAVKGVK